MFFDRIWPLWGYDSKKEEYITWDTKKEWNVARAAVELVVVMIPLIALKQVGTEMLHIARMVVSDFVKWYK